MAGESERLKRLITKGESVLATHRELPPGVISAFTLDVGAFNEWMTQCLAFLGSVVGSDHVYYCRFKEEVTVETVSDVNSGIGILRAVLEDLADNVPGDSASARLDPIHSVEQICLRFHQVAKQLRRRHASRPTLDITDEYDVQDLFHAILRVFFEDVRTEEYTPSYAGGSARMDFLLPHEEMVVEIKKTRSGLEARDLGSQLIEDIARYRQHPRCKTILCFIYDPDGRVGNPVGLERDLSRQEGNLAVKVLICPRQ